MTDSQLKKTIIITSSRSSRNYLSELWRFRELWLAFIIRDLKLRYKQTALGIFWVILQPLFSATLFTFIFGSLFQFGQSQNAALITSDKPVPYALFVFSGLIFWNFFSDGLSFGANSLINQADLIKKIYFPRLIAPLSAVSVAGFNFCLNLIILLIFMPFFGLTPHWQFFAILPLLIITTIITTSGAAFLLSALNLKYRDIKQILPFLLQSMLFMAPIIYPVSILPSNLVWLAYLNPLTSIIEIARASLLGTAFPATNLILISIFAGLIIFCLGLYYFRRTEKFFADIA